MKNRLFITLLLCCSLSTFALNPDKVTCTGCGGSGRVTMMIGVDMFGFPVFNTFPCGFCGGAGYVVIEPTPFIPQVPFSPQVPFIPSTPNVQPSPSTTIVTPSESSSSSSSRSCGYCKGSGWYTCPCESASNFGSERGSHTCSNCGQLHTRGAHSCKCTKCGGTGRIQN